MTSQSRLRIEGTALVLNGTPIRLFSGAMHYFRTLPEQWPDRLAKLKAMGLNTIETYVPWNMHEPRPGEFHYQGLADLPRFAATVAEMGLNLIVRPGPYICAEWEFGGLPAWLLADDSLSLRCADPAYLAAVDRFYDDLLPRLLPHTAERGGNIIAMQVENEYGSYGGDKAYLDHLARGLRDRGYEGLLFTSDGPTDPMLRNGTLPGIWKTANFGSRADEGFAKLREYEAGPLMCMEYWNGWFDHWGEPHHARDAADAGKSLDDILSAGAHVNIYMAHGGTNFGFWSGANTDDAGAYQPTTTSYDYDAPLTEAGEPTAKYHAYQAILARHGAETKPPPAKSGAAFAEITATQAGSAPLLPNIEQIGQRHELVTPRPMEKLGQASGFILYRTEIDYPAGQVVLTADVRDRGLVFLDGQPVGELHRNGARTLPLDVKPGPHRLDILVENQGRVNYGKQLRDPKGLIGSVWLGYTELVGWQAFSLPLDDLSGLDFGGEAATPGFHRFNLVAQQPADAYLDLLGWGKGVAFFNGFNLGRYWQIGPQRRLYVPAPLIKTGENELVLFETDAIGQPPRLVAEQAWTSSAAV